MSIFKHHIFVCQNERESSDPRGCCVARGSHEVLEAFKAELKSRGLKGEVRANKAGCLDQCAFGPSVVIYPEGTWYAHVKPSDVPEIVTSMLEGKRINRLLHPKQKRDGIQ